MKKLIFLLFVALLVTLSQATIIKFEAEDSRYIDVPGTNWSTVDDEAALGGKCITATEDQSVVTPSEATIRYYSFSAPEGTYRLYVRYQITDPGNRYNNDSFFCSDSSFAIDATMALRNGIAGAGLDGVSTLANYGWVQIDTNYVSDGSTAIFKLQPREDGLLIDSIVFATEDEIEGLTDELLNSIAGTGEPHDPLVLPVWEGIGTSGDLQANNVDVEVSFAYTATADPNEDFPMHPGIVGHYIYLTVDGADVDPNLTQIAYVEHVDMNDPNVAYGPYEEFLIQDTRYEWQAEDALDSGGGTPYPAGDPNNIVGAVWSFNTVAAQPVIVGDPENVLTDTSGNGSFTVVAGPAPIITSYQWYKVGDPDVALSDVGIYSGTTTDTLTITNATASDDGQFYCIVYNGAIASDPSASAWLWYPRLVSHYPFETMDYVADANGITPDIVSGFDAAMKSNDTGGDVPSLEPNVVPGLASTYSLKLNNPAADPADPNNGDAQYAAVAAPTASSYQDVTISAWIYWNGGGIWQRILDFGNDTDNYMFLCPAGNTGGLRFAVKVAGTEQAVTAPSSVGTIPTGEWTYVTATLSDDTARVYVNGEMVGDGSITLNPVSYGPTTQNWIGRSQWPDPYFNGLIDELKIYNYALSTEQIAQDYLDIRGDWVCNQELNDLLFDYDNNCEIGIGDLAIIVEEWVVSYRIYPE